MSGHVDAPFNPEQIAWINAYQASGVFHPLTCENLHKDRVLLAQTSGMTCRSCDYTQDWVPAFAADPRWLKRVQDSKDME